MNEVESEIHRRAKSLAKQQYLAVDYYRIRRKLAIPLPVNDDFEINCPVRCFSSAYPWGIWLGWALEDRIETLGEFVERTSDIEVRHVVERDLRALAGWRGYRETDRPDLPYAHLVRSLWVAVSRWRWLDDSLRKLLTQALERAVNDALPFSDQLFGQFKSVQDVLSTPSPHQHLHNIPLIGTCALALAANSVRHPDAARLDERVSLLFSAILELRQQGFTEGVSYDGYVLTFIADWLSTQSPSVRAKFVDHPSMDGMIDQIVHLGVPGRVFESAPLGDVEFSKMPFVWSAIAKLLAIKSRSAVAWALSKCEVSLLRADALVALLGLLEKERGIALPQACSPVQVNYALAMRTGYDRNDICVAVGLSKSPMGHIHCDNGSLVLGTRGRWWLDDPGYQQYLKTSEQQFTVGGKAHNAPVIDGHAQILKQPELLAATRLDDSDDVQFAFLDLTGCYPAKAGVGRVRRAVWLIGNEHLVVCDDLALTSGQSLSYHWHGHPDLFWCLREGSATLVSEDDPDRSLHIFSPQISLDTTDLLRLPGSRGQQTLSITLYPPNETTVWWVFSFAAERPSFSVSEQQLQIAGRVLRMDDRFPLMSGSWHPLSRRFPLHVSATRQGDTIIGRCEASHDYFQGDLEYAFYLMINGEKAQMVWYTPDPEASFTLPGDLGEVDLEVRGFVREKATPEKKLMQRAVVPPSGRGGIPREVDSLFKRFKAQRGFFVLGSGPSASVVNLHKDQTLVCINGSMGVSGCRNPDILVVNDPTLTEAEGVAKMSRKSFRDRHVRLLVCISKLNTFDQMKSQLRDLGLTWDIAVELSAKERREVAGIIVGREVPDSPGNALAASAGMTAVCLAHLAGGELVISGFDFSGGHFHTAGTRRGHTPIDKEIALVLTKAGCVIFD